MYKIILASGSPRRKELLQNAGYDFEVKVSDAEEKTNGVKPDDIVEELSYIKAKAVFDLCKENELLVIGADTIVWNDGNILGKPKDKQDAVNMIKSISGKAHEVYTGVSFIWRDATGKSNSKSFNCCTKVFVNELSESEIIAYTDTTEPYDKAGSYAVQGIFSRHIGRIEGDYFNVVGLPVSMVYDEIRKIIL